MKLLALGDSHVATLQLGLRQIRGSEHHDLDGADVAFIPFGPADRCVEQFFEVEGHQVRITHPRLRGRGAVIPPGEHYDWYVLSAMFNTFGVVRDRATWNRFDPPGTDSGRTPVSAALFQQLVADHQRYIRELVQTLNGFGLPLVIVESPYPFRRTRVVQEIGPHRALAVDHLMRQSAHDFLAGMRVPVVEVPAALRDEEGFTKQALANSRWPHHGNADFGAAMLEEVLRFLRQTASTE